MIEKKWIAWICPLLIVAVSILAFVALDKVQYQNQLVSFCLSAAIILVTLAVADIVLAFRRKKIVGAIVRIVLYLLYIVGGWGCIFVLLGMGSGGMPVEPLKEKEAKIASADDVRRLTGLDYIPELTFVEGDKGSKFNGVVFSECVTFDIPGGLSKDVENKLLSDAKRGDSFCWTYKKDDLAADEVAHLTNTVYSESDTVFYGVVFCQTKLYVLTRKPYYVPFEDFGTAGFPNYRFIALKDATHFPPGDGQRHYYISFTGSYSEWLDEAKKAGCSVDRTPSEITVSRAFSSDGDYVTMVINKKKNTALITFEYF